MGALLRSLPSFSILAFVSLAGAVGKRYDGHDTSYAGSGTQYGEWDQNTRKLRLEASRTSDMSTSRCMDAMLDWKVSNFTGHYDSRFVRSCQPGHKVAGAYGSIDSTR